MGLGLLGSSDSALPSGLGSGRESSFPSSSSVFHFPHCHKYLAVSPASPSQKR